MSIVITGGQWRGRHVPTPKHNRIRPTTSRMRESIFSQRQQQIPGSRVLDGFAGTGIISLEALSRGAALAMSAEKHRPQALHLKQLVNEFHIPPEQWLIMAQPFEQLIAKPCPTQPFNWVYLDPPYPAVSLNTVHQWLAPIIPNGWLTEQGQVWLEHPTKFVPHSPTYQRQYGDSTISQWAATDLIQAYPL